MDYRQMKLDKSKDKVVTDYENVPEQRGGFVPLVQPGDYLFELPKNIDTAWAEPFMASVGDEQLERVAAQFDPEHPLVIVGAPPVIKEADPGIVGQVLRVRVANNERNRARRGDPPALVSDMHYLLYKGLEYAGEAPKGNLDWIIAMNAQAGKRFVAALEWSAFCSDRSVRYIEDGQGGTSEDPSGEKGCGARFYQSQLPRVQTPEQAEELGLPLGAYLERFACSGAIQTGEGTAECGASLRCFPNLTRFRPASFADSWD